MLDQVLSQILVLEKMGPPKGGHRHTSFIAVASVLVVGGSFVIFYCTLKVGCPQAKHGFKQHERMMFAQAHCSYATRYTCVRAASCGGIFLLLTTWCPAYHRRVRCNLDEWNIILSLKKSSWYMLYATYERRKFLFVLKSGESRIYTYTKDHRLKDHTTLPSKSFSHHLLLLQLIMVIPGISSACSVTTSVYLVAHGPCDRASEDHIALPGGGDGVPGCRIHGWR